MFGDGESSEDPRIAFLLVCSHGERCLDLERLYHGTYYALDERVPRLRHASDGHLFHNTDVFTERELKTSPVHDAFSRFHCGNALHVRLDGPHGSRTMWMVQDPIDDDGWSSARPDLIRRLLPHIRQTVRVQVALGRPGTLGMTLERLLEPPVWASSSSTVARQSWGRTTGPGACWAPAMSCPTPVAACPARRQGPTRNCGICLPGPCRRSEPAGRAARCLRGVPPARCWYLHVTPVGAGEAEPGAWPAGPHARCCAGDRAGCGHRRGSPTLHPRPGPSGRASRPGDDGARGRRGHGPQGEHRTLARQAHVHQARAQPAGRPRPAGTVPGGHGGRRPRLLTISRSRSRRICRGDTRGGAPRLHRDLSGRGVGRRDWIRTNDPHHVKVVL